LNWSEVRERIADLSLSDFQLYQAGVEMGMDSQRRKHNSLTVFWLADVSICVD